MVSFLTLNALIFRVLCDFMLNDHFLICQKHKYKDDVLCIFK